MLEERTSAIVLRSRPHGESDKIVTFLTRDWGKVTAIAKGAKRSQRRFVNVLEPFTHVRLRFRPGRAEELAFIFGCDLLQSFRGPSGDLQRFALASYLCELIDAMVTGREAGEETYTLLLETLQLLENPGDISPASLPAFELLLLAHTGYAPHFTDCHQCGRELTEASSWVFSPGLGGLLCAECRDRGGSTVVLSVDTVHFLADIKHAPLAAVLNFPAPPRVSKELRAVAGAMLARHLHRPLKSRVFLEQTYRLTDDSVDARQGE
ncbi:MAG TPA: DNA repair protein RecO [Methylomirabilota bacterium]|jgi:DNA repair protein RecO (recombination protein O)|nr:DNA repair protein RecO [Methylomirabilota bacterium]